MTERYKIAVVGAASLRGKELNEALADSSFSSAEIALIDDESEAGQIEATGEEATVIQPIDEDSFAHVDFAFFTGAEEMTQKHWKAALGAGASIVDSSDALEKVPGVLVLAPWLFEESAGLRTESVNLNTPAIVPAHPVALVLGLLVARLQKAGALHGASATVLEAASEYGRAAIDELHHQTVALLSFKSLPKEIYDAQVAFNILPSFGDSRILGKSEARIRRHYQLLRGGKLADVGIQLVHAPVFHGVGLSLAVEFDQPLPVERVEAALHGEHIEIAARYAPPDSLRSAGQSDVVVQVRSQSSAGEATGHFWIWASFDNLKIASLNAVACAMELRKLRPQGEVQ